MLSDSSDEDEVKDEAKDKVKVLEFLEPTNSFNPFGSAVEPKPKIKILPPMMSRAHSKSPFGFIKEKFFSKARGGGKDKSQ